MLALGIYLTAIKLITYLGNLPWDAVAIGPDGFRIWATGPGVWEKGYDVEMVVRNQQDPLSPLRLKTEHVVTGLWETMVQISEESFYYETVLTVLSDYWEIGTITIQELTPGVANNNTNTKAEPRTLSSFSPLTAHVDSGPTHAKAPANLTTNPTYPSGQVPFPRDPRFSVKYIYLDSPRPQTQKIPSKDIFMSILGLLATSAQFYPERSMQPMAQESPSQRCRITLIQTDIRYHVSYANAAVALGQLVSAVMLPLEKFGAMNFWVAFEDVRIAQGAVVRLIPTPLAEEER